MPEGGTLRDLERGIFRGNLKIFVRMDRITDGDAVVIGADRHVKRDAVLGKGNGALLRTVDVFCLFAGGDGVGFVDLLDLRNAAVFQSLGEIRHAGFHAEGRPIEDGFALLHGDVGQAALRAQPQDGLNGAVGGGKRPDATFHFVAHDEFQRCAAGDPIQGRFAGDLRHAVFVGRYDAVR